MALRKEWPQEITIPFAEWKKTNDTLVIIRSFTDAEYIDIKCPGCGLMGYWFKDEEGAKISCICGHHEYALCACGEALTDEKKSPFESNWCISCRKDWAHGEKLCPECERDLEDDPHHKGYLHCPGGCIDPIPEATYWDVK